MLGQTSGVATTKGIRTTSSLGWFQKQKSSPPSLQAFHLVYIGEAKIDLSSLTDQWFTIINPASGTYNKSRVRRLLEAMKGAKLSAAHAVTEYPLHAAEIAREAIDKGFRKLVLVGGDGTYHEVVNSMVDHESEIATSDVTLAMFPSGTGNDWVRSSGINKSVDDCVQRMADEQSILQDVGRFSYYDKNEKKSAHFLNVAGCGFDAYVEENYLKNNKTFGKLSYFSGLLKGLLTWENVEMRVEADDFQFEGKAFSIIMGIGKFFGGGMKVTPEAIIDDGLFDITIIGDVGKFEVVKVLPKLYSGKFTNHPKVQTLRTKSLRISSSAPIFMQADGELRGAAPFEFEILPKKLRILHGRST